MGLVYEVEAYEEAMESKRRMKSELVIPATMRNDMLLGYGYTQKEIQEASKKSTIARNQRKWTLETIKLEPFERFFEGVKKNPLRLRKNKRTIKPLDDCSSSCVSRSKI